MYNQSDKTYQMNEQIFSYPAPPPQGAPPMQYGQTMPDPRFNQPYPTPIMQQPGQPVTNFYPAPNAPQQVPFGPYSNPLVPRGLEQLLVTESLIIEQQVELIEAFTGFETNNKYIVKNLNGQHLYYAAEETDFCTRLCIGSTRPFTIKLMDNVRNEIMRLDRPWRCNGCLPFCMQQLDIYGGGQKFGSIEQEWSLCIPNFAVLDSVGQKVLHIEGPLLTCSCGGDVQFTVLSSDKKTEVGKISKQWSGLAREVFTDADRFGIEFPRDLDVTIKAVLLGATFLIDYMFFENSRGSH